ncbi:LacI family DNA-binding transcriptional regulator [Clostridium tetani]|uniref:LacI family transcriptional regulator n=1 Tax=Clostridium tetani TaxID=1513 RepID=A0ABY0EQJ4_CLOTA|nr:LacI family DNA-binding transcriptional regulator [Clostridium tetani]CDI50535.1 catabolite control protein [Clostridium tetani 12124569]KHO32629.1 LacI family transcriptional regulator [Clostridium tetani]RXI39329.1 LacI family transcriptional regulator [Clostridium tetani]RXI57362.1 LacI family transcriptional regulator [Clostridium tetani]RXI66940.1 LacI family transcriptional regulator [Clostridium tetani]
MKKVTMMDIAKIAKVSKTTVSMVINNSDSGISEETRKKILSIAEELNYIPNSLARSLSTRKSGTIGIILPDITNPYFSEMARAIEDVANSLGHNVIFCNTDNEEKKEEKYTRLLLSKAVDGIIFISGGESTKSIDMLKKNNVKFVMVDRPIKTDKNSYGIYSLNKKGVIKGMNYLLSKNIKKIAFVKGPKRLENTKERFNGYKEVMESYNLYNEFYVYEGDFTIESGIEVTEKIIREIPDVEAIFCSNDMMAFGGIKVLLRNGYKIPEDIAIMGFDNINISKYIEPELTTIAQPIYSMGKEACRMLISIINGDKEVKRQIFFDTDLIIRKTV